ncbi:unnamed protein product [Rhizoctonia solani]|uniref:Uncharacterized protein n=1 Tax=Rhizoctonia solani TaxID=456999 RepID=A0A8H2X1B5_9AGAM|nr:unnamed protein product [Rhizoctonia solani]
MSTEFFDFIQVIKPSLGDNQRAKIGLILMHYITLTRVSGGRVRIDQVLTTSGKPFARQILRNMSLVRDLAFALRVDMSYPYDDSPVPERLRHLCQQYHIDVEACIGHNKKLADARAEMSNLIIFVRVAQAVMAALHEDTLRALDESYAGHRPSDYKPKSKWFGIGAEHPNHPIRACDLPGAKPPRPVGSKSVGATFGPIPMARNNTDGSSVSSTSGSKSHRPIGTMPRVDRACQHEHIPLLAVPSQATYYAQCAATAAYYQTLQRGMASRRVY